MLCTNVIRNDMEELQEENCRINYSEIVTDLAD